MTINIAIAVSEGLVMAADSLSQMSHPDGRAVSTLHQSVEKITEIGGRSIALMINGLGEIRKRTIISLVREFEFEQYGVRGAPIRNWTVETLASNLASFIGRGYREAYPVPSADARATESRPDLGIIVGGYSPGKFFPEVFEISFPAGIWTRRFPEAAEPLHGGEFIEYWGQKSALDRILYGYDRATISGAQDLAGMVEQLRHGPVEGVNMRFEQLPEEYRSLPPPSAENLVAALMGLGRVIRMQNRLNGMPLQEAVEFVEYLGNVAIGYDRFKTGLPAVGGELDIVAIQPEGLHWYKRKPFLQKMADARDAALTQQERQQMRAALGTMETIAKALEGGTTPPEPPPESPPAPPPSS